MAVVTFSRRRVESLMGRKLSVEQWNERASLLGVGFEGISGDELSLEVYPNRPDLPSEPGMARAMKSFLGGRKGMVKYSAQKSDYSLTVDPSVNKVRPFTACAVVKGLKLDDVSIKNIIQFQEKLHATYCRNRKKAAIGIYPLERISWPIRYIARRPNEIKFQPLESGRPMSGSEILEKHPAGKAYAQLLEDADRYPIFIDSNDKVLSMPPIINSEHTGRVTTSTKDVFVECSGFDLRVLQKLLNIIVTSLADIGGKVFSVNLKYGSKKAVTPDFEPSKMDLDVKYVNGLLGTDYIESTAKRLLEKMGYGSQGKQVLVPSYRTDILHPCDLAEDIAIAAGYDRFKPAIPEVATIANESAQYTFKKHISDLLVGLGLMETNTFHLTSLENQTRDMQSENQVIELANSLNAEYNVLRASMLPSLMAVLRGNKHHDYPHKLFGIGTIFEHDKSSDTGVGEKQCLGVVSSHPRADYTEIRQVLEYLLDRLSLQFIVKEAHNPSFIPGRAAEIFIDKKKVAVIGEIHPQVLRNWELDQPVTALELDLQAVSSLVQE